MNHNDGSGVQTAARVRRSVLYLPGSNERAMEKARTLPADALVFDLEDAVLPETKVRARDAVCGAVLSGGYGAREVTVRINGLGTEWHEADLAAACAVSPDGIVVPKVSSAEEVLHLDQALAHHGAPDHTRLWVMLETPTAILNAVEIAAASERLAVMVMGTNDLANELRAKQVPGRVTVRLALQLCILAARSAGKVILDGVYNDIDDAGGFHAECVQAQEFGFDGKTVIHPSQINPCNEVFSPSEGDIAAAQEIVTCFEAAQADGRGVATLNGRMIEQLHVDDAWRILHMAEVLEFEARR